MMDSVSEIENLKETVARLRGPGGCPWDIEQTHKSLCDCLMEEVAELMDTIDRDDKAHMREELGDLLLQVVMHAQIAEEEGHFTFEDVAGEINRKLIRRHPHVFGDVRLDSADAVLKQWDQIKAQERKDKGGEEKVFKDVPPSLCALLTAREIYKQIRKKSLPAEDFLDKEIVAERSEGLDEERAGRELFHWVAACREAGVDPESALRRYVGKVRESVESRVVGQR